MSALRLAYSCRTVGVPRQCNLSFTQTTMRLSLSLFTAALLTTACASNVIDLVPENFDQIIGQGKPALVEL